MPMRRSCDEENTYEKSFVAALILPAALAAQDTVAPTTAEKVGSPRGEDTGDYNMVQSWELGYRFASVGGNQDQVPQRCQLSMTACACWAAR